MSKPRTFQKSTTKAHDMEMMITSHRGSSSSSDSRNDKGEFKKNPKFSNKDPMLFQLGSDSNL